MKIRFVILLLLFLPFAACDLKDDVGVVESNAIRFSSPSLETRSLINDVSDMTGGFAVYASRYNAEGYVDNNFFNNVSVAQDGTYEGEYYWTPGAGHEFFAVYPRDLNYALDATGKILSVAGTGPNGKVQAGTDGSGNNILKDILYDIALYDEPYVPGSNPGKIKFDLKHACSAISFSINNLSGKRITSVTAFNGSGNVEITGLYDEGNLNFSIVDGLPAAGWSSLADGVMSLTLPAMTVTYPDVWSHGTERTWDTLILIPQNFASRKIQMSFRVTYEGYTYDTYEVTLSDIRTGGGGYEYQAGKHYKYKIDITNQDIMCYVNIVPWIEDETIVLE